MTLAAKRIVVGEDIGNELVDWFNAVDLSYRTDLRELNGLNFARFDAKLEQRLAELRAELRTSSNDRVARSLTLPSRAPPRPGASHPSLPP